MFFPIVELLAGFAILTLGGHYLVRGSVSIALLSQVSTAVVGLTIVAFGTSLPEMAVSLNAASQGSTDIAYANVVGSSIFNLAVILSITALVRPVLIRSETRRFEQPFMFMVLALCLYLARDRLISRPEGAVLVAGLMAFLAVTYFRARNAPPAPEKGPEWDVPLAADQDRGRRWAMSLGLVGIGIVGLWAGSEFMVRGAVSIAETWGISERIIGLTVIAMGTSMPELATSAVASYHGEDEIALSNLMGSNIFNILAVLGATSLLVPVPVHVQAAALDNWVMLGFGAAMFPLMWTSKRVTRVHGVILLVGFAVYFGVLVTVG